MNYLSTVTIVAGVLTFGIGVFMLVLAKRKKTQLVCKRANLLEALSDLLDGRCLSDAVPVLIAVTEKALEHSYKDGNAKLLELVRERRRHISTPTKTEGLN